MVISYAAEGKGGTGPSVDAVWKIAGALKAAGIPSFNGQQSTNLMLMHDTVLAKVAGKRAACRVFVAVVTPEYVRSKPCLEELYGAYKTSGTTVVAVCLREPPKLHTWWSAHVERSTDESLREHVGVVARSIIAGHYTDAFSLGGAPQFFPGGGKEFVPETMGGELVGKVGGVLSAR